MLKNRKQPRVYQDPPSQKNRTRSKKLIDAPPLNKVNSNWVEIKDGYMFLPNAIDIIEKNKFQLNTFRDLKAALRRLSGFYSFKSALQETGLLVYGENLIFLV